MIPNTIHIEQDTQSRILSYRFVTIHQGKYHRFTITDQSLQNILEKFAKKLFEIAEKG